MSTDDRLDAATGLTRGLVAYHVLIPLFQSRYTRCTGVYSLGFCVSVSGLVAYHVLIGVWL
jgi:hypothetical protein